MTGVSKARPGPVLFVSSTGPTFRIDFSVEPVISLRHDTTAALRVARTVTDENAGTPVVSEEFSRLPDDDLLRIDVETFEFASQDLTRSEPGTTLIVPASFNTLAGRKGRRMLTEAFGARLKTGAMIELMEVDRGTPVSRLTEVGALVSSLCRGMLVRLSPGRDAAAPVRGYRPHGLTVEAAELGEGDSQVAAQLLAFAEQVKGAAPTLMVFGLPNEGFFAVAMVGGITHASAKPEESQARSAA